MNEGARADGSARLPFVVPAAIAFAIAAVAVLVGVRTGYSEVDVDEAVYVQTLRSMQRGEGYYDAHRDALIDKEGAPPASVRAVRPPTLFLVLRWLPEDAWRWVVGLVYLAALLAAARLGEPYGRYGAVAAVVLAGLWVLAAAPVLFLHAEVWGLPLLLWGAVTFRRDAPSAAVLIAAATCVRELYAVVLVLGLVVARRRLPWVAALVATAALGAVHVMLAQSILAEGGREAALGNEPMSVRLVLTILSPGDSAFSWVAGLAMLAAGALGLWRAGRADPAARLLLPFGAIMMPASVVATRVYWSMTWGPAVASFVPAALRRPARRAPMPAQAPADRP